MEIWAEQDIMEPIATHTIENPLVAVQGETVKVGYHQTERRGYRASRSDQGLYYTVRRTSDHDYRWHD